MDAPHQKHSDTSFEAAVAIEPDAASLRGVVLAFLRRRRPDGATDEEIQSQLQMPPNTQRPRRVELVGLGLVEASGERRKNASGRSAVVWVAKQEPRE